MNNTTKCIVVKIDNAGNCSLNNVEGHVYQGKRTWTSAEACIGLLHNQGYRVWIRGSNEIIFKKR
jgi:hypothetical protein